MGEEKLADLYLNSSKHSDYQELHPSVKELLDIEGPTVVKRHEASRMEFFKSCISFSDKDILDIGGNTGYFTLDALSSGARSVDFYEGNREHAEFVKRVGKELGLNSSLNVYNEYYLFNNSDSKKYDIVFLLNVLHHVGDDYGDQSLAMDDVKALVLSQLNSMASMSRHLIFQLGYNWKGNTSLGIFSGGTKSEQLEFLQKGISEFWVIERIGIATDFDNKIKYLDPNPVNMERNDGFGEFLNRPVFILKSKILS